MRFITGLAVIFLIIGGLNWGIIGVAKFNVIEYLLSMIYLDRIVYCAVGLSAIYVALAWKFIRKPPTRSYR